ncbi:inorganic diphosphatase [Rufibacter ruber]|uniref:inorganic diphosphatase n=1 Tax=Rufibacter ruber TaxID=1783499 RepID=UPI00082DBD11|nr:inorganic diphosphatase [Rufibacter ruber]
MKNLTTATFYACTTPFRVLLPVLLCLTAFGCKKNLRELPALTQTKHWQAVIETPAGSSHPLVYAAEQKEFVPQTEAGQPRQLEFLPYPANHGFIPSTLVDSAQGRPAAPLPVLVISEKLEPGTVLEILPVGVMILDRDGELHHLIIAVPARPSEQTISPNSYSDFSARYPAVKSILQQWYLNENPRRPTRLSGWKDEQFAERLIQQWVR